MIRDYLSKPHQGQTASRGDHLYLVLLFLSLMPWAAAWGDSTIKATLPDKGDSAMAEAREYEKWGQFQQAALAWSKALDYYKEENNDFQLTEARLGLAVAYHSLGQINLAYHVLKSANVEQIKDRNQRAKVYGELGCLEMIGASAGDENCKCSELIDQAETNLKSCLNEATDPVLKGKAENNLGILHSPIFYGADVHFDQAIVDAKMGHSPELAIKASFNLIKYQLKCKDGTPESLLSQANEAWKELLVLPDSHDKINLLITAGSIYADLENEDAKLRKKAFDAFDAAARLAEGHRNFVAESYALSHEAQLYEEEKRYGEALGLTRRAIHFAQCGRSSAALYRWNWQLGRILIAQSNSDGARQEAIKAYQNAVDILEGMEAERIQRLQKADANKPADPIAISSGGLLVGIRNDVAQYDGNLPMASSFRSEVGDLYMELADLLIEKAQSMEKGSPSEQNELKRARSVFLRLKAVELEDYFQDSCVHLLKSQETSPDSLSSTAAVIYVISTAKRTCILVVTQIPSPPTSAKKVTGGKVTLPPPAFAVFTPQINITKDRLNDLAHDFKIKISSDTYADKAQAIYSNIIQPEIGYLVEKNIHTLVFVPDGNLSKIPMAALEDPAGNFLIHQFAVAITPGIALLPAPSRQTIDPHLLFAGFFIGNSEFPPLPASKKQIDAIKLVFDDAHFQPFSDNNFTKDNIKASLSPFLPRDVGLIADLTKPTKSKEAVQYTYVHLVSHAEFNNNVRESFILTGDAFGKDHLSLNELEGLIKPRQLSATPIDLLTLSACGTAEGDDDRAQLGLAGIAVKAGARCVLATLWPIQDGEGISFTTFYQKLKEPGMNKAEALACAQQEFLANHPDKRQPITWAAYQIIGNWL